jgi:hypothetical protein
VKSTTCPNVTFLFFDDRYLKSKMKRLEPRQLNLFTHLLHGLPLALIKKLLLNRRLDVQREFTSMRHMQVLQYHRDVVRAECLGSDLSTKIERDRGILRSEVLEDAGMGVNLDLDSL